MQIDDTVIVKGLGWIVAAISSALTSIVWYIWRGDRKRIKALEDGMAQAITKPEVDDIVEGVERKFREDHKSIVDEIRAVNNRMEENMRDFRRELISILKQPWNGNDRRNSDD